MTNRIENLECIHHSRALGNDSKRNCSTTRRTHPTANDQFVQPFGKPKGWAAGRLERMWMAQGEGGQRLFTIPALQLVIAIIAGNYGRDDQGIPPTRLLREVILPSIL